MFVRENEKESRRSEFATVFLPDPETIRERFVESSLRYFALAHPQFWDESCSRHAPYPSDFLGKLRLGAHPDNYERILTICRGAKFPTFVHGRVKVVFPLNEKGGRPQPPDISFHLTDIAEWPQAQDELSRYLGFERGKSQLSKDAKLLVDFAAQVPPGKTAMVPRTLIANWSFYQCENAVTEAQSCEPRLMADGTSYMDAKIVVGAEPLQSLVNPSLDLSLNFPTQPSKSACDELARQIEKIVVGRRQSGEPGTEWIVLVRTTSRTQVAKSFGKLRSPEAICSRIRPVAMRLWWSFPSGGAPWILAVRPEKNLNWAQVLEAIREASEDVGSAQRYGLSKEAGSLLDWLRSLSSEDFEWGLSPELSEDRLKVDIGLDNPWKYENGFLFFRLLAEEISRKSPFTAVAHRWKDFPQGSVRIEFRP